MNVEIKSDVPSRLALVRAVVRAIDRVSGVDVVISSFDPRVVLTASALAPRIPRGMLVGGSNGRLATALPLAVRPAISAAHLHDDMFVGRRVARLRRFRLRTVAWTVNSVERAVALRAMGVDWVITDNPGGVIRALRLASG